MSKTTIIILMSSMYLGVSVVSIFGDDMLLLLKKGIKKLHNLTN